MLIYDYGKDEEKNWVIAETAFDSRYLGKCESIMAQGNGYLGIRATHEEAYPKEKRNLFVAGSYNRFSHSEPTELPNAADLTGMDIILNGEVFSLDKGRIHFYIKLLSLKTGELVREVIWESPKKESFQLIFRRFVSLRHHHFLGIKVEIISLSGSASVQINSGINGQMTNSGTQHFLEGEKRIFDKKHLQLVQTTTESSIDFIIQATHSMKVNGTLVEQSPKMEIARRKVSLQYQLEIERDQVLTVEKIGSVHTSRDQNVGENGKDLARLREKALFEIKEVSHAGYNWMFEKSKEEWSRYWELVDIQIHSEDERDQLAIRFAEYHLRIMTPYHDSRCGVGAKGLTGEGYKGHSFWDSEIFILPYFLYTQPEVARSLLIYRYHTLKGARQKAKENGYEGAMFPWESALTGNEETPLWAAVNVLTGEATKVWSGIIEQHITADIAFAVWNYYTLTQDVDFMIRYGSEILFEAATFWASRLEWDDDRQQYVIHNVIGPDEYKEHVNNNAFTNHMAHWTIEQAIHHYENFNLSEKELLEDLNKRLSLHSHYEKWKSVVDKIYLPSARDEDNIIPQDDTYLSKPSMDLTKYKLTSSVQTILQDFSREQVIGMQVSKQADIVMLLYLLNERFSDEVKKRNLDYYESKTLHDSSLSMAVHSIVSANLGKVEDAYQFFKDAAFIDLGDNMRSSDDGIHAASLGAIWKSITFGFTGLKGRDERLILRPQLPKQWSKLVLPIHWRGDQLLIELSPKTVTLENQTKSNKELQVEIFGIRYILKDRLEINANIWGTDYENS